MERRRDLFKSRWPTREVGLLPKIWSMYSIVFGAEIGRVRARAAAPGWGWQLPASSWKPRAERSVQSADLGREQR